MLFIYFLVIYGTMIPFIHLFPFYDETVFRQVDCIKQKEEL